MFVSGLLSPRRVPDPVRVEFDVVMARAWEALAASHEQQAVTFVRRLAGRLGTDEAVQRYFREIAVPLQMRDTVRARILLALTPEERHRTVADTSEPWKLLRPDHLVDAVRRRTRWVEDTSLAIRLAAAAAEESVIDTHVAMALEAAQVLAPSLALDEGLMQYVKAIGLAPAAAPLVFQRAMARLAETEVMITAEIPAQLPAEAPVPAAPMRLMAVN